MLYAFAQHRPHAADINGGEAKHKEKEELENTMAMCIDYTPRQIHPPYENVRKSFNVRKTIVSI